MNEKLINLVDENVFKLLVLERKKGIFTDELYRISEKVWDLAQKDILDKLEQFEKKEKILIITQDDMELLHGFDFTQKDHIDAKRNFKYFLKRNLST